MGCANVNVLPSVACAVAMIVTASTASAVPFDREVYTAIYYELRPATPPRDRVAETRPDPVRNDRPSATPTVPKHVTPEPRFAAQPPRTGTRPGFSRDGMSHAPAPDAPAPPALRIRVSPQPTQPPQHQPPRRDAHSAHHGSTRHGAAMSIRPHAQHVAPNHAQHHARVRQNMAMHPRTIQPRVIPPAAEQQAARPLIPQATLRPVDPPPGHTEHDRFMPPPDRSLYDYSQEHPYYGYQQGEPVYNYGYFGANHDTPNWSKHRGYYGDKTEWFYGRTDRNTHRMPR